jgi:hypothetical protein
MDEETLTVWLDTALLMLGGFVLMATLMMTVNPPATSSEADGVPAPGIAEPVFPSPRLPPQPSRSLGVDTDQRRRQEGMTPTQSKRIVPDTVRIGWACAPVVTDDGHGDGTIDRGERRVLGALGGARKTPQGIP